ncbi:centrosomal protein of 89 kDa-like isoform X1 [Styela clava]
MSQRNKKTKSLDHIGTALVPPVAFAAVPNTPPPTPPTPSRSMKFWKKRKKTPSPSPILPVLMGINRTARAVGLSFAESSSARSSPDRSSQIPDVSMDYEGGYASIATRGRSRRRDNDGGRDMVVEAQVVQSAAQDRMQGRHEDIYARSRKGKSSGDVADTQKKGSPRDKQKRADPSIGKADVEQLGYELEDKQRRLEEKMQMQNDETREMVREVMTRQHEDSLRRSHRSSEISYDLDELDVDNQALMDENNRLIKKNSALVEQNKNLHALSEALKRAGKQGSPRTKVEEILNENDILRGTVERLNTELHKFQEKYGELPGKPKSRRSLSDGLEQKPKWLTEVEYLSPLFTSYDAQLQEKDRIIKMLGGSQGSEEKNKWDNLSEQNNLMTEEIQILMQQLEMAKQKSSEANKSNAREVARLSKAVAVAEAEAEVSTEMVAKLQQELNDLKKNHEKIVSESAEKIPAKEHVTAVNELKEEIESIKEASQKELSNAMKKIKGIEEERAALTLDITDSKIKNKQLEGQIKALTQAYDKLQDKCTDMGSELEDSDKRNSECEAHLAEVLRLVDKTSAERDALAALVEKEQRMTEQALRSQMHGKWEMGKMEQTVKQYKKQASNQMNNITDKIRGLEESHQGRLQEYHREMSHLRRLLQQKQAMLDDVTHEKRLMENELENVWQAATSENRRIMDSFYKSKVLD